MNTKFKSLFHSTVITVVAGLCGLQAAGAATVDLAGVPMVSGVSKVVPPNIYFILDDSGSMNDENMPDDVSSNSTKNCFRNFGYNKIYYNPSVNYTPPKNADGTSFANSVYTAAKVDGFSAASATVDLSKTVFALGNNPFTTTNGSKTVTVAHSAHGYPVGTIVTFTVFSPAADATFRGVTIVSGNNYSITSVAANSYTIQVANNATSSGSGGGDGASGNGVVETASYAARAYTWYDYTASPLTPSTTCASDASYTRRVPSTAAEKTNFANWYSYYRKRILMMKSASGRAFATVDDKYRVGFSSISNKGNGGELPQPEQVHLLRRGHAEVQLLRQALQGVRRQTTRRCAARCPRRGACIRAR